jgi:hypothetical protein
MTSAKLKRLSYQVSVMDLNTDSIRISDIKSSNDFFKSVKSILCGYSNDAETYVLEFNWNENKKVKYEVLTEEISHHKPKIGEIQIFQMNIAKKGNIEFDLDPKVGAITFHTFDIGGQIVLDRITQNEEDIDFEIVDLGRPNEELLRYLAKTEDGSILEDSVGAYFSYGDDETEVYEELDATLREITNEWYKAIFKRK